MSAIRILVGILTFVIGVVIIAAPAIPAQTICDVMTPGEVLATAIVGAFICVSGILNIVRT